MEPFGRAVRLRNMGRELSSRREVRLDAVEAARLAGDCHRVAAVIDEHVALLLAGRYDGLRGSGSGGYRSAVQAVAVRLSERADELRSAARGLAVRSSTITDADRFAARRIADLGHRGLAALR